MGCGRYTRAAPFAGRTGWAFGPNDFPPYIHPCWHTQTRNRKLIVACRLRIEYLNFRSAAARAVMGWRQLGPFNACGGSHETILPGSSVVARSGVGSREDGPAGAPSRSPRRTPWSTSSTPRKPPSSALARTGPGKAARIDPPGGRRPQAPLRRMSRADERQDRGRRCARMPPRSTFTRGSPPG